LKFSDHYHQIKTQTIEYGRNGLHAVKIEHTHEWN
jgi:hypothetical protein